MFAFEDEGGVLPVHEVGVNVHGTVPGTGSAFHYLAEIGNGRTQTFFRAGDVIIELVGPVERADEPLGERIFGLSPAVNDLEACAELLGDRLGPIKDATQPGRRIATLRHEACGLTIPIAFMSADPR